MKVFNSQKRFHFPINFTSVHNTLAKILLVYAISFTINFANTYTVTNTNDSGPGSLRQAILYAEGNSGPDLIIFDLFWGDPKTFEFSSDLTLSKDDTLKMSQSVEFIIHENATFHNNGGVIELITSCKVKVYGTFINENGGTIKNGGSWNISNGGLFSNLSESFIFNYNQFDITGEGELVNYSDFINEGALDISYQGNLTNYGTISNEHSIDIKGYFQNEDTIINNGVIESECDDIVINNGFIIGNPIDEAFCWTGNAGDNLWSTQSNWNNNEVPLSSSRIKIWDAAEVILDFSYTLTGQLKIRNSSLIITETASFTNEGFIVIYLGNIYIPGKTKILNYGIFINNNSIDNSEYIENYGTFTNNQTIEYAGYATGEIRNSGTFINTEDGFLYHGIKNFSDGHFINSGTIQITHRTNENFGSINNIQGAVFEVKNEFVNKNEGIIKNFGTLQVTLGNNSIIENELGGVIVNYVNASITIDPGYTVNNLGVINNFGTIKNLGLLNNTGKLCGGLLDGNPVTGHAALVDCPITVNAIDDIDDGSCDDGHCSLREAISKANLNSNRDTIFFAIPGESPFAIQPLTPLPEITAPVVIDGTTQLGYESAPLINLIGTNAGQANGLVLNSEKNIVKGLSITNFSLSGIRLGESAGDNLIGGDLPGAGNIIAFNGGPGIKIESEADKGNTFWGNSIHSNAGIGIDFYGDGVTVNDPGDNDEGPNGLMNFPFLTSAVLGRSGCNIEGVIDCKDPQNTTVEFFSNSIYDPSGFGEGERCLGIDTVGNDGKFKAIFSGISEGEYISATATDGFGNTSEFSLAVPVQKQGTVSAQTNSYDIFKYDTVEGELSKVTNFPGYDEYNPDWSPDGNFVIHDIVLGGTSNQVCLAKTNLVRGVTTFLPDTRGGNDVKWSPQNVELILDFEGNIYTYNLKTLRKTLIYEGGFSAAWSPNAGKIVFERAKDNTICIIDVNKPSFVTEVVKLDEPYIFGSNPKWTKDGQWIVYIDRGIKKIQINKKGDPIGEPIFVLEDTDENKFFLGNVGKDSRTIVLHSNYMVPDFDVFTVLLDGSELTRVTGIDGYGDWNPVWDPGQRYIAFCGYSGSVLNKENNIEEMLVEIPLEFKLGQNYPNPFNPVTTINYSLKEQCKVTLQVFDVLGREVKNLVNEIQSAGFYTVRFDSNDLSSGIYYYKIAAGGFAETKKMILIK